MSRVTSKRSLVWLGAATAALAAASACATTDFSKADAGLVDAAAADAPGTPADGAAADGPADGGPGVFDRWSPCDGNAHTLCDDFDQNGTALGPLWTNVSTVGGTVTRVVSKSVSAPGSLQVESAGRPGPSSPQSTLSASITTPTSRIRCTFDLFVDVGGGGADTAQILRLQAQVSGASGFTYYAADLRAGAQLQLAVFGSRTDGGSYIETTSAVALGLQQWHLVTVTLSTANDAGTGTLALQLDNGAVQDVTISTPDQPSQITVRPGLDALSSGSGPWRVYYDDFYCDRN